MKVLLVDPGKVGESWYSSRQCPSLGLAYIASNLKKHGHHVKILDMATYGLTLDNLGDITRKYKPEITGISAASFNILDAYEAAAATKTVSPETLVVLGGAHPSALPKRTLDECREADAVVVGEGERVMVNLCEDPRPGIYYGERIHDLDSLPSPDWSMYDYRKYVKAYSITYDDERHIYPLVTSRGCIHNKCKFCYQLHGRGGRLRSPDNVVNEIEDNYNRLGADFWYFGDSTFSPNRKHLKQICTELINRELDISFKCQTRVDMATRETLALLKEAGCELVFYGIESGDQDILDKSGKRITVEKTRQAVKNAAEIGLTVRGSFILGLDGDTMETIHKTITFAEELKRLGLDQAQFHCLDLYPGTEFWNMVLRGEGSLRSNYDLYDWSVFSRQTPHVETNDVTIAALMKLKEKLDG